MMSIFKTMIPFLYVYLFLTCLFGLSSCASKPTDPQEVIKDNMQVMRDAVSNVVKNVERRNSLLALTKTLETTLSEYDQAYTDFAIEFGKLNRNYDTPRAKLEELLTSLRKARDSTINELVNLHFSMVAQTSDDEWKKIVKKELDAIESMRKSLDDQLGGKT